jgi:hypothetical protein
MIGLSMVILLDVSPVHLTKGETNQVVMEAIFGAEKGEELLFLTVLANTYCVCLAWWAILRIVDAARAHAAGVLVSIVLILNSMSGHITISRKRMN